MHKTWPGIDCITAKGLSIWKMDYYLIIAANLPVQPKFLAPKAQVITVSSRIKPLSCTVRKWMSYTKDTLSLVCAESTYFKTKNTYYYWSHCLVTCDIMVPLIPVTPSSQIQGPAISSMSKPVGAQVVFFIFLLSGFQYPCKFCLMESSDGNALWQKDGSGEILIITFGFFFFTEWHDTPQFTFSITGLHPAPLSADSRWLDMFLRLSNYSVSLSVIQRERGSRRPSQCQRGPGNISVI